VLDDLQTGKVIGWLENAAPSKTQTSKTHTLKRLSVYSFRSFVPLQNQWEKEDLKKPKTIIGTGSSLLVN